jgi:MGT family glycosyltransferase
MAALPLVYMTFGSVAGGMEMTAHAYAAAIDGAGAMEARVLFTVGAGADVDGFGRPPANVHIEPWVPQADVLAHAAAVVCHGGSGSTLGALAAGRPTVVVPLFADQPYNAARVEGTGAGIAVTSPTADGIRRAVETVLADGSYRTAAGRVAAEMRAHPPASAAVELIAGL